MGSFLCSTELHYLNLQVFVHLLLWPPVGNGENSPLQGSLCCLGPGTEYLLFPSTHSHTVIKPFESLAPRFYIVSSHGQNLCNLLVLYLLALYICIIIIIIITACSEFTLHRALYKATEPLLVRVHHLSV